MNASVRAALIAAGGCEHTPEPHKGCDTCGRPPTALARRKQVIAYDWRATTVDGAVFDKKDVLSVANLPLDRVAKLEVQTDDITIPVVKVSCKPQEGERLYLFTRHCAHVGAGAVETERVSVTVLEIRKQDSTSFVRLYLHPTQGPILSTEDLYF